MNDAPPNEPPKSKTLLKGCLGCFVLSAIGCGVLGYLATQDSAGLLAMRLELNLEKGDTAVIERLSVPEVHEDLTVFAQTQPQIDLDRDNLDDSSTEVYGIAERDESFAKRRYPIRFGIGKVDGAWRAINVRRFFKQGVAKIKGVYAMKGEGWSMNVPGGWAVEIKRGEALKYGGNIAGAYGPPETEPSFGDERKFEDIKTSEGIEVTVSFKSFEGKDAAAIQAAYDKLKAECSSSAEWKDESSVRGLAKSKGKSLLGKKELAVRQLIVATAKGIYDVHGYGPVSQEAELNAAVTSFFAQPLRAGSGAPASKAPGADAGDEAPDKK